MSRNIGDIFVDSAVKRDERGNLVLDGAGNPIEVLARFKVTNVRTEKKDDGTEVRIEESEFVEYVV